MLKTYLTVDEVASTLRVQVRAVRRMIATGKLPAIKPGKSWLIERRDFESLLDQRGMRRAS